ncbi:MAG TPA: arsenite methyltransferase [Acidobacteriota bacterium]|nr:arsenite methyltransferase [Acidobacteriota bacterium]
MKDDKREAKRKLVRKFYGQQISKQTESCCSGDSDAAQVQEDFEFFGYSPQEVREFHGGAAAGLCCGNPLPGAAIKAGETVLDLGSGRGLDCYLAARLVGETGKVIGVDMTPELVSSSRSRIATLGRRNIDIRLGEIENLPVADNSVDVVISNCVINLSPDKPRVFQEIFRVLKPGGRLAVSDIVAITELPAELREDSDAYVQCIAGAALVTDLENMLIGAGFERVSVAPQQESRSVIRKWKAGEKAADAVASALITAIKPA